MHAKRVTVQQKDMQLARRIRGDRHYDFVDRGSKDTHDVALQLPHTMNKAGMADLKKAVNSLGS